MAYLSGAGLPRLSWKKMPLNGCVNGLLVYVLRRFVTSRAELRWVLLMLQH